MSLTDWRLHDGAVLFIQFQDDRTHAGRAAAFAEIAQLARAKSLPALVVEARPTELLRAPPGMLSHHEAVADHIHASGAQIYVLVARACADARHHVFAVQRRGLTARRVSGREGAITLARKLVAGHDRGASSA